MLIYTKQHIFMSDKSLSLLCPSIDMIIIIHDQSI